MGQMLEGGSGQTQGVERDSADRQSSGWGWSYRVQEEIWREMERMVGPVTGLGIPHLMLVLVTYSNLGGCLCL